MVEGFWGVVGRTRRGSHPHSGKKTDPLTRIGCEHMLSGIPPRQVPPQTAVALRHARLRASVEPAGVLTPNGKKTDPLTRIGLFGASSGIRTPDTLLKRQVLCRLS